MKGHKNVRKLAMCLIIFLGYCSIIWGQSPSSQDELNKGLGDLIKYFKDDEEKEAKSGMINIPGAYRLIGLSDEPINLQMKETVLKNPYGDDFPVSYSVIYKGRLISLFQSGFFTTHSIQTLERDLSYEKKINTKRFDYHWLIGNKLVGLSEGRYFCLNSADKWIAYKDSIPLWNQPKLFEDAKYLVFCDRFGEFGGSVYFFNKKTGKTYFTGANEANTVYKKDDKYYILYELGHLSVIRSSLKEIPDPDLLTPISLEEVRKTTRGRFGYYDASKAQSIIFRLEPITFHSTFNYKGRTVYLTTNLGRTFLAEKENDSIKIVNPLFNNSFVMHYPVTTSYSDTILINRAWYMIGRYREISCFIIKDDEFIKIDWNEKH